MINKLFLVLSLILVSACSSAPSPPEPKGDPVAINPVNISLKDLEV